MTEEDDGQYRINSISRFWAKTIEIDKFRDHCQLSGKYRGPPHNNCLSNVTQKQSNFILKLF